MKSIPFAIAAVLLIAGLAVAAEKFDRFVWSSGDIGGKVYEKAAILVPVEFEGVTRKVFAQLDTGSDATILYGKSLRRLGVPVDSSRGKTPSFRWYGHEGSTGEWEKAEVIDWSMDTDTGSAAEHPDELIVGTIGFDKIVRKILILDFPRCEYAVLEDTARLEEAVKPEVEYIDAIVSYNKLYFNLLLGEDTVQAVRYDCGSSIAILILPRDWWQWATGLAGNEPEIKRDSVPAWGEYLHIISAPSKYDLAIGSFKVSKPEVTAVEWSDESLGSGKFLGNAAFYDSCVVVIDGIREKFGVAIDK